MMVLIGLVVGAFLGWHTARRRGGNRADRAQYAAVFAIIFALLGLVATVVLEGLL